MPQATNLLGIHIFYNRWGHHDDVATARILPESIHVLLSYNIIMIKSIAISRFFFKPTSIKDIQASGLDVTDNALRCT